jgi:hypothetical protein
MRISILWSDWPEQRKPGRKLLTCPSQGQVLNELWGGAHDPIFLRPYEANGEPSRLLAGYKDGSVTVVDPEAGTILHRAAAGVGRHCHIFETDDGRVVLATATGGVLLVLHDLGQAAPRPEGRLLAAANKLG